MPFRGRSRTPAIVGEKPISGAFQVKCHHRCLVSMETQTYYKAAGDLQTITII